MSQLSTTRSTNNNQPNLVQTKSPSFIYSSYRFDPLPEETPHRGIIQVKVDISLKNNTIFV